MPRPLPTLIVQIPCLNETETLPLTVADIPRQIDGVGRVEILVVDDGSTDDTVRVARELGVDHVVQHPYRRGLAAAFQTGIETALNFGADIIVNTDGDNQYPQADIPRLIAPLLANEADIVVGDRQTATIAEFSWRKRLLQAWGSWVVRLASGTNVPDATSGFRAYSREAALRLNLFTRYTYTLETIIQAGKKGLRVAYVPVRVNPRTRESRLIRSEWDYVWHSMLAILRLYVIYEPMKTFTFVSSPFFGVGIVLLGRFLYYYLLGELLGSARLIQSVVIGATSAVIGFLILLFGVLAEVMGANRRLLEETLYRLKAAELRNRQRERNDVGH